MSKKNFNRIDCVIKEDDIRMIFSVYDGNTKIETFEHYFNWHDEDDLCVRMQEKINITSTEFYEMWRKVVIEAIVFEKKPATVFTREEEK